MAFVLESVGLCRIVYGMWGFRLICYARELLGRIICEENGRDEDASSVFSLLLLPSSSSSLLASSTSLQNVRH